MYLDYTHGLFITLTEFRLSTTFIPIIIITYMHNWYHSNVSSILYTHGHNCNVQLLYTWRIPLAFISPCRFPFVSPLLPSLLTWNPPSCDRIRPLRSQVACKLTSPVPTLYPNPPPSKFPEPQLPSALLRRPQE